MAYPKFTNFVEGTLNAAITDAAAVSCTVNWASNTTVPSSLSTDNYMLLVIDPEAAEHAPEIVKATNITGSGPHTLTIVRAQEGSTAQQWDSGRKIVGAVTGGALTNLVTTDDLNQTIAGVKTFSSTITGSIDGNAATATEATNVTAVANNSADETVYPTFVDGATGTQGIETDTGLTYNPSSGVLTTTSVTGNLTGNVTGNVTGNLTGDVTGDVTGNVTGNLTLDSVAITAIQTSSEPFDDNNTSVMTSAAIQDKIESYGYAKVTISTSSASGGSDGDVWFKY